MDKDTERKLAAAKVRIEGIRSEGRKAVEMPLYDNTELDTLRNQLAAFERKRRQETRTLPARHEIKDALFAMVRELDRTAPKQLQVLDENYELVPSAKSMRLGEMVDVFEKWQDKMRADPRGHSNKELQELCALKIETIARAIGARRDLIQPKHPPTVDPWRQNALQGVNVKKFIPFAEEFAEAYAKDRKTIDGAWMLHHLPELNKIAQHTEISLVMLNLAEAVQRIVRTCDVKPMRYWEINRPEFQRRLNIMVDSFEAELPPNMRYKRFVDTTRIVREAKDVDSLRKAAAALKTIALTHIMGDHEEDNHKLFTQIGEAYKRDKRLVAAEEQAFEQNRRSDGEEFKNPLTRQCEVMNLIYEARWALAADMVRKNLRAYKLTLADPTISAENPASPTNYETAIGPKGIVAREKAARDARKAARQRPVEVAGDDDASHVTRAKQRSTRPSNDKGRS